MMSMKNSGSSAHSWLESESEAAAAEAPLHARHFYLSQQPQGPFVQNGNTDNPEFSEKFNMLVAHNLKVLVLI